MTWVRQHKVVFAGLVALVIAAVFAVALLGMPSSIFANDTPTATKTAKVVSSGQEGNGSAASPIAVNLGDEIEYKLSVNLPDIFQPKPQYDVLFVLDWSFSMNAGYEEGQQATKNGDEKWTARLKAKSTIMTLSKDMFGAYPGSRIAVMGLNSNDRNRNQPGYTHIQVDTNFVTSKDYSSVIEKAFTSKPSLKFDDVGMFLQAALDKMNGKVPATYGGNASPYPGGNPAPKVTIKPRTEIGKRIPVIVMISDFQYGMGDFSKQPYYGGNWDHFTTVADAFKRKYPQGILLAARADTIESTDEFKGKFGTQQHDIAMNNAFTNRGGTENNKPRWGWVKFEKGQSQEYQDSLLFELIKNKVPVPSTATQISDLLPKGLEYVKSEPGGTKTTVGGQDLVTWDLPSLPIGTTTVTVKAKVKEYGTFVNKADVAVKGHDTITTNPTYHKATPPKLPAKLHLRQIILERANSTVELPPKGYLHLDTQGSSIGVTANSGVEGVGTTDFTEYVIALTSASSVYTITDIVPQYYEYVGHVTTTKNVAHDPAAAKGGDASVDFAANDEYWVTVYLKPQKTEPGNYTWDIHANDFGEVFKK
jgi:hypothetical protein